jgi:hypothetical protein
MQSATLDDPVAQFDKGQRGLSYQLHANCLVRKPTEWVPLDAFLACKDQIATDETKRDSTNFLMTRCQPTATGNPSVRQNLHDCLWPLADLGEVHFYVCFEGVKRKSSRSDVTSAYEPKADIARSIIPAFRTRRRSGGSASALLQRASRPNLRSAHCRIIPPSISRT